MSLVDRLRGHAGKKQSVLLEVEHLTAVSLRNADVANQHGTHREERKQVIDM